MRESTLADGIYGGNVQAKNMDAEQYAASRTSPSVARCQPLECLEATCRKMQAAYDHFWASYVSQSDRWKYYLEDHGRAAASADRV